MIFTENPVFWSQKFSIDDEEEEEEEMIPHETLTVWNCLLWAFWATSVSVSNGHSTEQTVFTQVLGTLDDDGDDDDDESFSGLQ